MRKSLFKVGLCCVILFMGISSFAQSLNIGNLTYTVATKNIIYVAGQKGIAALNPDLSIIWEKQMPAASVRLIEVTDENIAVSSVLFEGSKETLLSGFSDLWDKLSYSQNNVSLLDLTGNIKWSTNLANKSKLSVPAVKNGIVAVSGNDSLFVFDAINGVVKSRTYCNQKWLLGAQMKNHAAPNKPLITNEAIYVAASFKFAKVGLDGKILGDKFAYGVFAQLPVLSTTPVMSENKIFVANAAVGRYGQKDGVSRIYCLKPNLDKDWDEYIDKDSQTGIGDMVVTKNAVIVSTNFKIEAYSHTGKELWTYDKKIGVNGLRGVRYSGSYTKSVYSTTILGVKVSQGNFLCADENNVYLASGARDKKVFKDHILVLDAKGKFIKTVDVDGTIVSMSLTDNALIVITENNKVVVINK